MHAAIVNYTLQPGRMTEFLTWYESVKPQLRGIPGVVAQYVVETDDANTIMAFSIFETDEAVTAPPTDPTVQEVLGRLMTFLVEGGVGERKVYHIFAHLS